MQRRTFFIMLISTGLAILAVTVIVLVIAQPVQAQCGSQASSCKSCHETQARKPVNADGTAWHQSHAFGDFCYICHGGNQQATDETAAHLGMAAPLADVKASCQQCHPNDLQARAQVYASALGVAASLTSGGGGSPTAIAIAPTAVAQVQPAAPQSPAPAAADASLVDYVQRYNENALGQRPTNWGNVILLVVVAGLILGGGLMVLRREGWIRISFKEMKPLEKEYPSDVIAMAVEFAALKPAARASLRHLLGKPAAAGELFAAIDRWSSQGSVEEQESETNASDSDSD